MWTVDDVRIEIDDADGPVMIVVISTPVGQMQICGSVSKIGNVLHIDRAHVDGLNWGEPA